MEEVKFNFKNYEWSTETVQKKLQGLAKNDLTLIKTDLSFAEMNGFLQFVLSLTEFVKKKLSEWVGQWLEFQAKRLIGGVDVAGAREMLNALAVEIKNKEKFLGEYAQAARLFNAAHPTQKANHIQWSTKEIMERSNNDQLRVERLKCQLSAFNEQFVEPVDYTQYIGFFEKALCRGNPDVIVVGEVFGEVDRLKGMINCLKEFGKLDENDRCKGDFRLVFLGNYSCKNIEPKGLEAIELLAALKMANPNNVFLLRGERETVKDFEEEDCGAWGAFSKKNSELAQGFAKRLPLSFFVAKNREKKVFVEFTSNPYLDLKNIENFFEGSERWIGVSKEVKKRRSLPESDACVYRPRVQNDNSLRAVKPFNDPFRIYSEAMIVLFNQDGTLWGHQGIYYDSGSGYQREFSATQYNQK